MGILLSMAFFTIAYISYFVNKKKISPTLIFSLLWGFIMLAEGMHLFGLYESDMITYLVIGVGVLCFSLGALLFKNVVVNDNLNKKAVGYEVKTHLFFSFMVVTILLCLYPTITNVSLMLSGKLSFSTLRMTFDNSYSNIVLKLLYNYIALPCSLACLPIVAVMLMTDRSIKIKVVAFSMTVFVIFERVMIDAGRGIVLYFFVILYFAYRLFGSKNNNFINKKQIKHLLVILFVVVILVYVLISLARRTSFADLFKQIYFYICGCVPLLDVNLKSINQEHICLMGVSGFRGLLQFVFTMLENIGLMNYPSFMQEADLWYNNSLLVQTIAPSTYFNSYATLFYNVYLDGGIIAVAIEMLIYGAFSRCVYNMVDKYPNNLRMKAIYLFVIHGLLFSFIRFQFVLVRNIIGYVFIFIIIGKRKMVDENNSN